MNAHMSHRTNTKQDEHRNDWRTNQYQKSYQEVETTNRIETVSFQYK